MRPSARLGASPLAHPLGAGRRPQVIYTTNPLEYTVERAPESRDVLWANLPISQVQREARTRLVAVATSALVGCGRAPVRKEGRAGQNAVVGGHSGPHLSLFTPPPPPPPPPPVSARSPAWPCVGAAAFWCIDLLLAYSGGICGLPYHPGKFGAHGALGIGERRPCRRWHYPGAQPNMLSDREALSHRSPLPVKWMVAVRGGRVSCPRWR